MQQGEHNAELNVGKFQDFISSRPLIAKAARAKHFGKSSSTLDDRRRLFHAVCLLFHIV